jgi:hypothetical protein
VPTSRALRGWRSLDRRTFPPLTFFVARRHHPAGSITGRKLTAFARSPTGVSQGEERIGVNLLSQDHRDVRPVKGSRSYNPERLPSYWSSRAACATCEP